MMSGNELQFGLIGLGVLAVAGVLIFNFWQERRARKHAEQAFRSTHHDVLLDEQGEPSIPPAPGGRMEPGLRREDWPLPDPKGQSLDAVRAIRDEVRDRVRALLVREALVPR